MTALELGLGLLDGLFADISLRFKEFREFLKGIGFHGGKF
jgi:hypothetical protein